MRNQIVRLNDQGQLIWESSRMSLVDRLEVLSSAFNEFSATLIDTERFYLFAFLRDEYDSLKSDLSLLAKFAEEAGEEAEERRERSEGTQRAGRVPQAL